MIANFQNISDSEFTLNGVEYKKTFIPVKVGKSDLVRVVNMYDSRMVLVKPTLFSDFQVDGQTFYSVESLIASLNDIVYSRVTFSEDEKQAIYDEIQSLQDTTARYAFDTLQEAQDKWASFSQEERDNLEGREYVIGDAVYKWTNTQPVEGDFVRDIVIQRPVIGREITITLEDGLPGVYNEQGEVIYENQNGYYRTEHIKIDGGRINITGRETATSPIHCFDKNLSWIGAKQNSSSINLPEGTEYIAFNLAAPSSPMSNDVVVEEVIIDNKDYTDFRVNDVLDQVNDIIHQEVVSAIIEHKDSLIGVWQEETGNVVYEDDEIFRRTPLIEVRTQNIRYSGRPRSGSPFLVFDENKEFMYSITTGISFNGQLSLPEEARYIAFNLRGRNNPDDESYRVTIYEITDNLEEFVTNIATKEQEGLKNYIDEEQFYEKYGRPFTVFASDFIGTDREKIQAAIDFVNGSGKEGSVVLKGQDTFLIDSAILIKSNVTLILDGCTLKLADNVFDNIIRASGINPDPENPNGVILSLDLTENFKILGVNGAKIEGADNPYTAPNPKTGVVEQWVGDEYGWRAIGILLSGSNNYEVGGFSMTKTHMWAISQEYSEDMYYHDIVFETTVKNGDGIDFRLGCKNGRVENIFGTTSDDAIAFTAISGTNDSYDNPESRNIFPAQTTGREIPQGRDGVIENFIVDNVHVSGRHHVVICLTVVDKVQNITLSNISDGGGGSKKSRIINIYTGYGAGEYVPGNINNIYANDVESLGGSIPLRVAAPIDVGVFNYLRRAGSGDTYEIHQDSTNIQVTNA